MTKNLLILAAVGALALQARGQEAPPSNATPPQAPAVPSRHTRFHAELGGFYSALSRGYGDWRGVDLKLQYASRRATPFIGLSSQTRDEGTQSSFGVGSYIRLNDRFYSIVGVSHAPDRGVVLYPKTRVDVALFGGVRSVPGLVAFGGVTEVYGASGGSGRSLSVGSFYYRGRTISTAVVSLNRDGLSGASSYSQHAGIQYGRQGSYWIGGGVSHGTEAYRVVADVPFDARFEGVGGTVFVQRWLRTDGGAVVRYDFQHKYTAYVRNALSLTYFYDF